MVIEIYESLQPVVCIRVLVCVSKGFRFDCSQNSTIGERQFAGMCAFFRDAVELRETEMSEINDARHRD